MLPIKLEMWMNTALELAQEAARADEVPVGAVLINEDTIIGQGFNIRESSGRTVAHAEIQALEDYNRRYHNWRLPPETSILVTTEPCLMCSGALLWARADHIYFGCEDPKGAGITAIADLVESGRYDHRFKDIRGGILVESCAKILTNYFATKRK